MGKHTPLAVKLCIAGAFSVLALCVSTEVLRVIDPLASLVATQRWLGVVGAILVTGWVATALIIARRSAQESS